MGKHWTQQECAYFIEQVIPLSKYATGVFSDDGGKGFGELVSQMQEDLDRLGQSRRTYTADNLFQHWYQKVRKGASTTS